MIGFNWEDLGMVYDTYAQEAHDEAEAAAAPAPDYGQGDQAAYSAPPKKAPPPSPSGYAGAVPGAADSIAGPDSGYDSPDEPPPSYGPGASENRDYSQPSDVPDEPPPSYGPGGNENQDYSSPAPTYAHDSNGSEAPSYGPGADESQNYGVPAPDPYASYPDESRHGGAAGPDPYVGTEYNQDYNPRNDQQFAETNIDMVGSPDRVGDPNDAATLAAFNDTSPRQRQQDWEANVDLVGTQRPGAPVEDQRNFDANVAMVGSPEFVGDPKDSAGMADEAWQRAHDDPSKHPVGEAIKKSIGAGLDYLFGTETGQKSIEGAVTGSPLLGPVVKALGGPTSASAATSSAVTKSVATGKSVASVAADWLGRASNTYAGGVGQLLDERDKKPLTLGDIAGKAATLPPKADGSPDLDAATMALQNERDTRILQGFKKGAEGGEVKPLSSRLDTPAFDHAITSLTDMQGRPLSTTSGAGFIAKGISKLAVDVATDPTNWGPQVIAPVVGAVFKKAGVPVLKVIGESRAMAVENETKEFVKALASGDDARVLAMQDATQRAGFTQALTRIPGVGPKIESALQRTAQGRANLFADRMNVGVEEAKNAGLTPENALKLAKGDTSVAGAEGIGATGRDALRTMRKDLETQVAKRDGAQASFMATVEGAAARAEVEGLPTVAQGIRDAVADGDLRKAADIAGQFSAKDTATKSLHDALDTFGNKFDADPIAKAAENVARAHARSLGLTANTGVADKVASNVVAAYKQGYLTGSIPTQVVNVADNAAKAALEGGGVATFSSVDHTVQGFGWRTPGPLQNEGGITKAASAFEKGKGWENPYLVTPIIAGPVHALGKAYGTVEALFTNGLFKNRVMQVADAAREPFSRMIPDIVRKSGLDPLSPRGAEIVAALQARIQSGVFSGKDLVDDIQTLVRQGGGTLPHIPPPGKMSPFVKGVSEELARIPANLSPEAKAAQAERIIAAAKVRASETAKGAAAAAKSMHGTDTAVTTYRAKMEALQNKLHGIVASVDGKEAAIHATEVFAETRNTVSEIRNAASAQIDALIQGGGITSVARAEIFKSSYQAQIAVLEESLAAIAKSTAKDVTAVSPEGLRIVKGLQQRMGARIREAQGMLKDEVRGLQTAQAAARSGKDAASAERISAQIKSAWNELDTWMVTEAETTAAKMRQAKFAQGATTTHSSVSALAPEYVAARTKSYKALKDAGVNGNAVNDIIRSYIADPAKATAMLHERLGFARASEVVQALEEYRLADQKVLMAKNALIGKGVSWRDQINNAVGLPHATIEGVGGVAGGIAGYQTAPEGSSPYDVAGYTAGGALLGGAIVAGVRGNVPKDVSLNILGIASPRYKVGTVAEFASETDALAFAARSSTKATADKAILKLRQLGWESDEIAAHGRKVREAFKDIGSRTPQGTKTAPTKFTIPDQGATGAPAKAVVRPQAPVQSAQPAQQAQRAAPRAAASTPRPSAPSSPNGTSTDAFWTRRASQTDTLHTETQTALDGMLAQYAKPPTPTSDLRPFAAQAVEAARQAAYHWQNVGEFASSKGYREVSRVYNDYTNGKTPIDKVLNVFFPFSMWQTRNPAYWGETILRNPVVGVELAKYFANSEVERERRGLPASYIGMTSIGKPGEYLAGTPLEGPANALFGKNEVFGNPVSPLFSIADQMVSVGKAYLDEQRARSNFAKGIGTQGDVSTAQAALAGSLFGGLGLWAPITEGVTAAGGAGTRQVSDPLPRVPAQNLIAAGAAALGVNFDPQAPVRRFLTDMQYKQLGQAPPYKGDKFEDLAVTTALRDMRIRGEIPGANDEEKDANLYGALRAMRQGEGDKGPVKNPTLARALAISETGDFKATVKRSVLPGRFDRQLTPEQQAVMDAKVARGEQDATAEAQKPIDDPRGYGPAYAKDYESPEQVAGRANSAGYKSEIELALAEQQSRMFSSPQDRESGTHARRDFIDAPANALYKDYLAWKADHPEVQYAASEYAKTDRAKAVYGKEAAPAEGRKPGAPVKPGTPPAKADPSDTTTIALADSQVDNAKADAISASLNSGRAVDDKYPALAAYQKAHPFGSQTAAQFQQGLDRAGLRKDYEAHRAEEAALKKSDPLAPYIADYNAKHGDAVRGTESYTAGFVHYMEHETRDTNGNGVPDGKEVLMAQAGLVQRGEDVYRKGQPVAVTPGAKGTPSASAAPDSKFYDGSDPAHPLLTTTGPAETKPAGAITPPGTTTTTTARTGGGTRSTGGGARTSTGGRATAAETAAEAEADGRVLTLPDGKTVTVPATATQTAETIAVNKNGDLFIKSGNSYVPIKSDAGVAALDKAAAGSFGLNLPPGVVYAGKDEATGNHKFVITTGTDEDGVPKQETLWVHSSGKAPTAGGTGGSTSSAAARAPQRDALGNPIPGTGSAAGGVRLGDAGISATASKQRLTSPEAQEAFNALPASVRQDIVGAIRFETAKALGKEPVKGDNPLSDASKAAFDALPEPLKAEIVASIKHSVSAGLGDADGDGKVDKPAAAARPAAAPRAAAAPKSSAPAAPVQRYTGTLSPSKTYKTKDGVVRTIQQMKDELGAAGYPGPWDDEAILAAFARTTNGTVLPVEGGAGSNASVSPVVATPMTMQQLAARLTAAR